MCWKWKLLKFHRRRCCPHFRFGLLGGKKKERKKEIWERKCRLSFMVAWKANIERRCCAKKKEKEKQQPQRKRNWNLRKRKERNRKKVEGKTEWVSGARDKKEGNICRTTKPQRKRGKWCRSRNREKWKKRNAFFFFDFFVCQNVVSSYEWMEIEKTS